MRKAHETKLSIILPAYNEEKRIEKTLKKYCSFFPDAEIIAVLNGCTDRTAEIVRKYPVKMLEFARSGKGFAVTEGFKAAGGRLIGFVDADCSTSPLEFKRLIDNIGTYDGIIASRYAKGSKVFPKQSIMRIIASRIFNCLIQILFLMSYSDTQCGAKIFRKEAIKKALPSLGITNWSFDIDLLYQMKRHKFKIKEFPTVWRDKGYSKLNLSKAIPNMLLSIIRLRIIHSPFRFLIT